MKNEKSKSKKQEKKPDKSKSKKTNQNTKILKSVLITCLVIIILILVVYFYINSLRSYTYEGVDFETVQEGDITLYKTFIMVPYQGSIAPYNFYLRTNPRVLQKVGFDDAEFELMTNAVLNFEDEFDCEGYEIIAVANLVQLHNSMGIGLIQDENATCDERYVLMNIVKGEETQVKKVGSNCYDIIINECEILQGTERMMLEMFVKYAEL